MMRALLTLTFATVAAGSNEFGIKFLEENKLKQGVITLPSGMQYKVISAGGGTDHPTPDSSCECHYEGRTAQEFSKDPTGDNQFDSSYKRGSPTSFAPNQVARTRAILSCRAPSSPTCSGACEQVIKGWTEAMQLMVEGDKCELYIPSELGAPAFAARHCMRRPRPRPPRRRPPPPPPID